MAIEKEVDSKRQLIVATKKLLSYKADFSTKEIVDLAFMNIASVNYHFMSKENLIYISVQEIFDELILQIKSAADLMTISVEESLQTFMNIVYEFSLKYKGAIKYLFLLSDNQGKKKLLDDLFLRAGLKDFVIEKLTEKYNKLTKAEAYAKYLLLFSSFALPIFLEDSMFSSGTDETIDFLHMSEFKKSYMAELIKILS